MRFEEIFDDDDDDDDVMSGLLDLHAQELVANEKQKGYATGNIEFTSLQVEYPIFGAQFVKYNAISSVPEEVEPIEGIVSSCSATIDTEIGCLRVDLNIPDLGDNLSNVLASSYIEAGALTLLGKLTELREYFIEHIRFPIIEDEANARLWDRLMIKGLWGIVLESHSDIEEMQDILSLVPDVTGCVQMYRQAIAKNIVPEYRSIMEQIPHAAMLVSALKNGYSIKQYNERISSAPFKGIQ